MTLSAEIAALRDEALTAITCEQWAAQQGWPLRRSGAELTGACPVCGGTDRFSINTRLDVWNCRGCGVGGDVIFLVQHSEGLKFAQACERITGRSAGAPPDLEKLRALEAEREAKRQRQAQEAQAYREKARRDAKAVWDRAAAPYDATLEGYLRLRRLEGDGLDLGRPGWAKGMPLRYAARRAYWHDRQVVYSGPAMIAAIQMPDGRFGGVHQTWIDLGTPKGKLELPPGPEGKALPAKKVLGLKKGCAIRLFTPPRARRMVMGEGIETTMTALAHAREAETAYWAGVDLGNMSGRAQRAAGGALVHDLPDLADDECFLPPDWVEELVYLCDGDEPEKHTVDKVRRGLRRARARREAARATGADLPPLTIMMVPPGDAGTDLNSIAMRATGVSEETGG